MKRLFSVLLLLWCCIGGAQATVITYDTGTSFPHVESGYTTTAGPGTANFGGCGPPCVNNGTRNVFSRDADITVSSATAFDLLSFEGGELFQGFPGTWASSILVTGNLVGGGTVTQSFNIDGIHDGTGPQVDFQVFALGGGFTNLSSVVFHGVTGAFGSGTGFTLDNVTVEVTQVPEPGSLVLTGIALAGLAARRRKLA